MKSKLLIAIAALLASVFAGAGYGDSLKEATHDLDMMLCQGVNKYQTSPPVTGDPVVFTAVNDFPFAVTLIYSDESDWIAIQVDAGAKFEQAIRDGSVLLAADDQINMCIGGLIIRQGEVSWPLSLKTTISDFNGDALVAKKPTQLDKKSVAVGNCPSGIIGTDLWDGEGQNADLSTGEIESCAAQMPDGTEVALTGRPSAVTLAESNIVSSLRLRKAVEAAEFCNLMTTESAQDFYSKLEAVGIRQAAIIVWARSSIEEGQTHWVKGRDDQFEDYFEQHLKSSSAMEKLAQKFTPNFDNPEFNAPCMCEKLDLSC